MENHAIVDLDDYPKFASNEYRKFAYDAASETSLENSKILPISKDKSVLLIGPTANSLNCLNGAWTHTWQGVNDKYNNDFPTIKDALESYYPNLAFFEGSKMIMQDGDEKDIQSDDLKKAITKANHAM